MKFTFTPMTEVFVQQLLTWKYEGEYAIYDSEIEADFYLDSASWGKKIFAVVNEEGELIGSFSFGFLENTDDWSTEIDGDVSQNKNCTLWIGLGLRPDLTGKGLGLSFVYACTEYAIQVAREKFGYTGEWIGLGVLQFNQRGIKVYERAGYEKFAELVVDDDDKKFPAQNMRKRI